ncbi:lectin-like domain-containing protein [Levilactobacillus humaensis]|uniref:lectin-like domain-containing protein n=1 Tax=Levilactobacillus humaensis TaxID=2950375 RepID=UPI0021C34015|nr:hypothetical protein [Levilactobacillus humaensis]
MKTIGLVMISFLLGCVLWGRSTQAFAGDTEDLHHALATTPQGIQLQDYFVPGTSLNNHAKIVDSQNPLVHNTQAVRLTNSESQVGSIWSTPKNTFKLNEPQTVSMWLYFGGAASWMTNVDPMKAPTGDGMAFVLQNDQRGVSATTQMPGDKPLGETLGVWGADTEPQDSNTGQVASSAIQKSWAVEFDSYINNDTSFGGAGKWNSFDVSQDPDHPIKFPHIASNYPGDRNSYQKKQLREGGILGWGVNTAYFTSLNHNGLIQGNNFQFLSDHQWHHFTLRYEPQVGTDTSKGQISYTFNDKDPKTGVTLPGLKQTVELDKSKVDNGTHETQWGFTGATGSLSENNLVVFDQVPDLVEVSANTHMADLTQGTNVAKTQMVRERDQVQLNYQVKYLNGKEQWNDVIADLKVPKNITLSSGSMTLASDPDHPTTIDEADLKNNEVTRPITAGLSATSTGATFSFTGKVKDGTGSVAPLTSQFRGKEAVAETSTPEFTVDPTLDLKLAIPNSLYVDPGKGAHITGKVQIGDPAWHNSDVHLQMSINGQSLEEPLKDSDERGVIDVDLPASFITKKTNTLTVTATGPDPTHNSQTKTMTIYIGELAFTSATPQVTFKGKLTGTMQRLACAQPLDLTITDTREKGNGWHLEAVASQLKRADGKSLDGDLQYFKDGQFLSLDAAQTVASHTNDGVTTMTHLSSETNQGLVLQVEGGAISGDYSGQVSWLLMNTP